MPEDIMSAAKPASVIWRRRPFENKERQALGELVFRIVEKNRFK